MGICQVSCSVLLNMTFESSQKHTVTAIYHIQTFQCLQFANAVANLLSSASFPPRSGRSDIEAHRT